MRYYSMRMKLDDVIRNKDVEQTILENVRRCSTLVGIEFQVVFWHDNLTEQNCKDFVKRNEHLLFEVNTKITKIKEDVWFLIGEGKGKDKAGRYRYDGDILNGISEYIKIISHMKKRDGE